ncbi:metallophosphoesterase family protein [Pseudorhodoplanes sp.]|uniref:metallophosphoesterase family protein n=1 Tax=Pseudorhodoplanes sp. TaxID=1934341 RepID=UPI002C4EF809|nr:metallophosphoesterase [Pseudorhodoplanes sp.]HWV51044.1 metallophosphoesterase [Pseudorhodoplanes sp.]
MTLLLDPRKGDIEDDTSSTKGRSLLSLAGTLLVEISLPKLVAAWLLLVALPCVLLGLTPLFGSAWLTTFSRSIGSTYGGLLTFAIVLIVLAVGWFGGRTIFRIAEQAFWALNAMAVQPLYALFREVIRHFAELALGRWLDDESRARLRAYSAAVAGFILCTISLFIIWLIGPFTRWSAEFSDLLSPVALIVPALANAGVILFAYCTAVTFVWGLADASMDQPRGWSSFVDAAVLKRSWRVVHLSDVHVVGERFGFRLESGRLGPSGNARFSKVLARLDEIHAQKPLDHILITGDITDAGRSAEWAEFFSALRAHPQIAARTLILPGNHDVNVVDRSNPAKLDFPTSPGRRLREMRALSGICAVQGARTHVVDPDRRRIGKTLDQALAPHAEDIAAFSDTGTLRLSARLARVWAEVFPIVLPPDTEDGLGIIMLNSTALTHFSFTNALGLMSSEQSRSMHAVVRQFPKARWIVALHHHLVEYPTQAIALSERIGTALINGSWFVRQVQRISRRAIVMHGHRHIDWTGACGRLVIVSAPSPVMEARDTDPTAFYIHTLGVDEAGRYLIAYPERVEVPGS